MTSRREAALETLAVTVVVVCAALAAWRAFPSWDDGVVWLNSIERGPDSLLDMVPDRPVMGWIWRLLARRGVLWPADVGAYLVTWLGTGWVARACWRTFFPEWKRFGGVAGLISVAPVLVATHTVALTGAVTGHIGCVLVYLSLIFVHRIERWQHPVLILAAMIIFAACLVSEYSVLATFVGSAAFAFVGGPPADGTSSRRRKYAFLSLVAVVGYAGFRALGDSSSRPETIPEHQLAAGLGHHLLDLIARLPFSLWTAVGGEFLKDLGEVNLSKASVVGLPVGALVAGIILLRLWKRAPTQGAADDSLRTAPTARFIRLLLCAAIGTAAVVFMSSAPRGNVTSRLWMPMLPLMSCLTLSFLLSIVRRRFWIGVAAVAAFVSGYASGNAAWNAYRIRKQIDELGAVLHGQLSPTGLTVAIFTNSPTNHFVGDPLPRPYELVSQLAWTWPAADRLRFWAAHYAWPPLLESLPGSGGFCRPIGWIDTDARGWRRKGPVAKMLWVSWDGNGQFHVEPQSISR